MECSYFPIEKSVITVRTYFIIYGLKLEEKYHFFKTNIRSLIWLPAGLYVFKMIVFPLSFRNKSIFKKIGNNRMKQIS